MSMRRVPSALLWSRESTRCTIHGSSTVQRPTPAPSDVADIPCATFRHRPKSSLNETLGTGYGSHAAGTALGIPTSISNGDSAVGERAPEPLRVGAPARLASENYFSPRASLHIDHQIVHEPVAVHWHEFYEVHLILAGEGT